jgi:hypothetical protein
VGEGIEAASGTLDLAHAEEIVEGTLDLEGWGMGGTGVECGNVYGVSGCGNDVQEVLREETPMQGVGAVLDEVSGL